MHNETQITYKYTHFLPNSNFFTKQEKLQTAIHQQYE
jgi:hypothetical protein